MAAANKPDRLLPYRAKRDFDRTSEPKGTERGHVGSHFVVQKHDARRLHYDLRLELDGVLLSWAIPNGPSAVSTDKRLAVRTEDHPLKYLNFEGTIPKGEYGGGTMILWDRGEWLPLYDTQKSLAKGHLEFELKGERLKGRWHLVRLKNRAGEKKEQWLFIKGADEHERSGDDPSILEEQTSVLSGRANKELNSDDIRIDHKNRAKVAGARKSALPKVGVMKGARKGLLRSFVEPSLASSAEKPPAGAPWWHEVKFDGYRVQARVDGGEVKLLTRTGLDWTHRFSAIAESVRGLGLPSAIIDGEIVVNDEAGVSDFNALVGDLKSGRQDRLRCYVFDLLYFDGSDLQNAALADRKRLLAAVLEAAPGDGRLILSEHFAIDGAKFFGHVSRLGLEGMISKRSDRPYISGRSKDWLKSKCVLGQEFVVVGFVPSTTARGAIGSLVLGYYENGELIHAGRAGSGFRQDEAQALFTTLESLRIDKPKFGRRIVAGAEAGVRWVQPRLVAEVEYRGWSRDNLLRHVTFRGLREDRDAREISREDVPRAPQMPMAAGITHPDRVLWPAEGITKQGLADFYLDIADWIMPHLAGRPLSLVRCPGGIAAECFYAKHAWAGLSEAVGRVKLGEKDPALFIRDVEGLLALVQSNALEIHPWGSLLADPERPDRLIFDLDPGEDVAWSAVVDAAREVRERLAANLKLESFVKTTGGKGLHVVVPLKPSLDWEAAKALCKSFAEEMASDSPAHYVANMAKSKRQGKIFVDYLRNGRGATAVAAYSTRARAGATVSIPIAWEELTDAFSSNHFRIGNAVRRLKNIKSDPWAGFFDAAQRLASRQVGATKAKRSR
jgi:bifunctional non-homologous end joining protein LigD